MRCVFPIESRDKCPSSSLQHGEARERNAVAVAHREGPPGHRCHGAARTSPTFATVAIQQSAGAAGAFECAGRAGRLPVLSRAARQRARTHVSREDSAIVIGISCSNFNSTRWPGRRPPAELPSHPAPAPPCLRESVEGAQNLTKTGTGHAPLGSPRQRLQQQRAYAHATKQLTRGVSSINRTRRASDKTGGGD